MLVQPFRDRLLRGPPLHWAPPTRAEPSRTASYTTDRARVDVLESFQQSPGTAHGLAALELEQQQHNTLLLLLLRRCRCC